MRKVTAKYLKHVSSKAQSYKKVETFQEVLELLALFAKLGYTNAFVDLHDNDIKVVRKELELRGFKVYTKLGYLEVEWN